MLSCVELGRDAWRRGVLRCAVMQPKRCGATCCTALRCGFTALRRVVLRCDVAHRVATCRRWSRLRVGSLVLGVVRQLKLDEAIISLPNNLTGVVHCRRARVCASVRPCVRASVRTPGCACGRVFVCAWVCARARAYMCVFMCLCERSCGHTRLRVCACRPVCTCMSARVHACVQ